MTVNALQKNESSKYSYTKTAAVGAVSCYILKWALPVMYQEKDERYYEGLKKVYSEVRNARKNEIESIRNSNCPGADEFINMHDKKQLNRRNIEKLSKLSATNVMNLFIRVNEYTKNVYSIYKSDLHTSTKSIRPTGTFVLSGILIGLGVAAINNMLGFMFKKPIVESDFDAE